MSLFSLAYESQRPCPRLPLRSKARRTPILVGSEDATPKPVKTQGTALTEGLGPTLQGLPIRDPMPLLVPSPASAQPLGDTAMLCGGNRHRHGPPQLHLAPLHAFFLPGQVRGSGHGDNFYLKTPAVSLLSATYIDFPEL